MYESPGPNSSTGLQKTADQKLENDNLKDMDPIQNIKFEEFDKDDKGEKKPFYTMDCMIFDRLRRNNNHDLITLQKSFNKPLNELKQNAGKSKFYTTQDKRYVIKNLKPGEVDTLKRIATRYDNHMDQYRDSFLTVYIGHFEITLAKAFTEAKKKPETVHVLVMENLTYGLKDPVTFDMKGIDTRDPKSGHIAEGTTNPTYTEKEFLVKFQDGFILVAPDNANFTTEDIYSMNKNVLERMRRDFDFLSEINTSDYSVFLMVEKDDGEDTTKSNANVFRGRLNVCDPKSPIPCEFVLRFAAIDIGLVEDDIWRRLETVVKTARKIFWPKLWNTVTIQRPEYYKQRLFDFMRKHVIPVKPKEDESRPKMEEIKSKKETSKERNVPKGEDLHKNGPKSR
ncbi:phosphatidylinositol-4-phosphate 5-Kinase domain-containing protein [Ditylenchus destructor]|uniref:Phosphatidylinositol-4-phosphate 5-Kinase domain-containing protein n=1 Tax=Ditylenchus destructor TaxID=166010 RepID=A0AAD4MSL5_9BILA|nr:phosphatidylinositol-4-phosphate 5-Kinase domain-containing protein [Ditylenchus destructor]